MARTTSDFKLPQIADIDHDTSGFQFWTGYLGTMVEINCQHRLQSLNIQNLSQYLEESWYDAHTIG